MKLMMMMMMVTKNALIYVSLRLILVNGILSSLHWIMAAHAPTISNLSVFIISYNNKALNINGSLQICRVSYNQFNINLKVYEVSNISNITL